MTGIKWSTVCISLYVTVVLLFSHYWAQNGMALTSKKGEEYFTYLYILIPVTALFLLVLYFMEKRYPFFWILLAPFVAVVVSVLILLALGIFTEFSEVFKSTIYTFGIIYSLFIAVVTFKMQNKTPSKTGRG